MHNVKDQNTVLLLLYIWRLMNDAMDPAFYLVFHNIYNSVLQRCDKCFFFFSIHNTDWLADMLDLAKQTICFSNTVFTE